MIRWMGAVLISVLLFLAESKRELGSFVVKRYSFSSPKLRGLRTDKKIILLADLHNKVYGNHNDELLRAIEAERPDLILIAGDMLVGKKNVSYDPALAFVSELPKICPVYYGLGNHEQRMKEFPEKYGFSAYARYRAALVHCGVHFLENAAEEIELDDAKIQLHGLELPMGNYEKFQRHSITASVVKQKIGACDSAKCQILIAHNPAFFPAYKEWGADLTVSGHLHGGIVRIPGLGGVITPQVKLFPKYSGEMTTEGEQAIVVSKGLGTHTVNLRFLNQAEVVAIILKKGALE